MRSSSVISVSERLSGANYKALTCAVAVSEDQGLPIGYNAIALTSTFVLCCVR